MASFTNWTTKESVEKETTANNGGFLGGLGYLGKKIEYGAVQAVEGIWDFLAGGVADIFGADEWAKEQMESTWLDYDAPDKYFNPDGGWKIAGDIASGLGNVLPTIALAAVTAGAGAGAGVVAAVGGATAGTSAAGGATREAYLETGDLTGDEWMYGVMVGTTEGLLEAATTGIGTGVGAITKAVRPTTKAATSAAKSGLGSLLGKTAKHIGKEFISEGVEEGLAEVAAPYYARATYDPNKPNATAEDVAYAAIIGGVTGVILGGAGATVNKVSTAISDTRAGTKAMENGYAAEVLASAKAVAEAEAKSPSGYDLLATIAETYNKVGDNPTKQQLGALYKQTSVARVLPQVDSALVQILADIPSAVAKYNATTGDSITAADLTANLPEGYMDKVNAATTTEARREVMREMRQAASKNDKLLRLAVASATGNMMVDAKAMVDYTEAGKLPTREEYEILAEDPNKRRAIEVLMGVSDLSTVSYEAFREKLAQYASTNGQDIAKAREDKAKMAAIPENTAEIPTDISALADGAHRFGGYGIIKAGNSVQIYDYETGRLSRPLTMEEAKAFFNKPVEAKDVEGWSEQNIVGYEELTGKEKRSVRLTVLQARSLGISDSDISVQVSVMARSGVRIEYTTTPEGVNGYYDPEKNVIVIDHKKKQPATKTLMHELSHTLYKDMPKFQKALDRASRKLDKAKADKVEERYGKDVATEEKGAYYAEDVLGNTATLARLTREEPTLGEKVLGFFNLAKTDYMGNARLSRAAGTLYTRFEEAFKSFSSANRLRLGVETVASGGARYSYSSIGQSFFGREATVKEMESGAYKTTEAYKAYVDKCVGTMTKTIGMTEAKARKEVESSIDGIVRVAIAAKKAGYDIADIGDGRTDSKGRMLFSSLEPNSDYFTSSDISTICDKRKTFSEIHDEIVSREEALGVPKGKRFFSNISNYYVLHDILAEKGMTAPCRECYVESMRKNLAPMAQAFLELMQETDVNNKNNKQLWAKGKQKTGNLELREKLLEAIASEEDPLIGIADLNEELLSTEHGITRLRLQAPMIYEAFNSFYGQSEPKMPKSPTPFRFGELTAMLTDENGNIKVGLIKKIKDTGGFRLQSYSDFQIVNFVDVLQVIFEAGTLGLNGHAYTKVPAFLVATDKTNLKRNISVFTYEDNGQWKIDKYDSFPGTLEELYEICKADTTGNTGIIVVTQNAENAAWVMANPHIWYFIGYHKSGQSMSVVRDKTVREGGRAIKGYANVKDHTRQQSEVWAKTVTIDGKTHKAGTKVKKGISIYDFWDFDNKRGLSQKKLLEKNLKEYISRCVEAGYHPRFREYLMNNSAVIEDIVKYSKEFGVDVTAEDVAFKYKGYTVPYGYAACLGDFSMFDQNGNAVPIERLSLADYDFDAAVKFFADSESLRRTELLQQIANDGERDRYITGDRKDWTTDQIREEIERIKSDIVESIVPSGKRFSVDLDIDSDGGLPTGDGGGLDNASSFWYTEEQYESFGWAPYNGVLNGGEYASFTKQFASAVKLNEKYRKTKRGEWMIPVSDIHDAEWEGVCRKIVYASGTIEKPVITRVLEINLSNETKLSEARRDTYEIERRGIQQETGGVFRRYDYSDFKRVQTSRGVVPKSAGYYNQLRANRRASGGRPERVTPFVRGAETGHYPVRAEFVDISGINRAVLSEGGGYRVLGSRVGRTFSTVGEAIHAENENIINGYARRYGKTKRQVIEALRKDPDLLKSARRTDKRFSLDLDAPAPTRGQIAKERAEARLTKVFDKKEIRTIVSALDGVGDLKKATVEDITDRVWEEFNKASGKMDSPERVDAASLAIAEYILEREVEQARVANPAYEDARQMVEHCNAGIRKIVNLTKSEKAELRHKYDKDGLTRFFGRWVNKTQGEGIPLGQFVQGFIADTGMEYLAEMQPIEALMAIDEMYEVASGVEETVSKYADISEEELAEMRRSISEDLQTAFAEGGRDSKVLTIKKRVSETANDYLTRLRQVASRNRIHKKLETLKGIATGKFAKDTQGLGDTFKGSISELAKMEWRGTLSATSVRTQFAKLAGWYADDNNAVINMGEPKGGFYLEEIDKALSEIGGKGNLPLSNDELVMVEDIVNYFTKFVRDYGKVWNEVTGQYEELRKSAEQMHSVMGEAKQFNGKADGKLVKTMLDNYRTTFFDPMSVLRMRDGYEDGFYTKVGEMLRRGSVDAQVDAMRVRKPIEAFLAEHKGYLEQAHSEKLSFRGAEISRMNLISLYMTLSRKHSWKGFAMQGVHILAEDGNNIDIRGNSELKTEEDWEIAAKTAQDDIAKLLTPDDMTYIKLLEENYNGELKQMKARRDFQRRGFSNISDDYYYPIRRYMARGSSLDDSSVEAELDRISKSSFNQSIVAGAAQPLVIEGADIVFERHLIGVTSYLHLQPAIDYYNAVYNYKPGNIAQNSIAHLESTYWADGKRYMQDLFRSVQRGGTATTLADSYARKAVSALRSGYATSALAANPKVWFTQLASFASASSMLDADSLAKGLAQDTSEVYKYCPLAELRAYDNTAVLAQTNTESKLYKVGKQKSKIIETLMAPISKMDALVIRKEFGACQVQVEKDGGPKVGTEENKIAAGKLLERVILETQQNALATERSAAMRSNSEFLRSVTMFTSDAMKNIGRVIDGYGEVKILKAKINAETDAKKKAALTERMKAAKKKLRRASMALATSSAYMVAVAQLFRFLLAKDEDDENPMLTVMVDFFGNMLGGLPLISDAYGLLFEGYEMDDYTYSMVNDILTSGKAIVTLAVDAVNGEASSQDVARAVKNLAMAGAQMFGIPFRNIYNNLYGITKRISPTAGYAIDSVFYEKNVDGDLAKALKKGDATMVAYLLGLSLDERVGVYDPAVYDEILTVISAGETVTAKKVPKTITVDGEEIELTKEQQSAIAAEYAKQQSALTSLVKSGVFSNLTNGQKAESINLAYKIAYNISQWKAIDTEPTSATVIASVVGAEKVALVSTLTAGIEADLDKKGEKVAGSRRKKIIKEINKLDLTPEEKMLLIIAKGYAIQDGDIRGMSAEQAKARLKKYIVKHKGLNKAQKEMLAERCGFEVKNGAIK